jgi:hypothetical protein
VAEDPGALTADDLEQVSGAGPVAPTAPADPADRADPAKMGAVLNGPPENWPPADQLTAAGITGVRITMSGGPSGNYTEATREGWQQKLQEYRNANIDVTLNVPAEASGVPMPEIPPSLRAENGMAGPEGQHPAHSVRPFTRDGQVLDGGPWSEQQRQDAVEWYQKFDQWTNDHHIPNLQAAQQTLGDSVNRYEIWNEPDEPKNWESYSPGLPAPAFGELMQRSYQTLKPGVDPSSPEAAATGPQIVSGGLDSGNPGYLDQAMEATGGTLWADAIGVHPYTKAPNDKPPSPETGNAGPWTGTLQSITQDYERFGKPILFTELGDRRGGNHNYIPEAATAVTGLPQVQRGYFFWEDPHDGEFGLHHRPEGTSGHEVLQPRPALDELTRRTHIPPPPPEE